MARTENRSVYISINGKEIKNTYRGIRNEVLKLNGQLANTTRGTKEFEQKSKELKEAREQFKKVREEVGYTNRSLKDNQNVLGGLKGMLIGAFSVAAVQQFVSRIVDVRSEFEKYFAVLKTSLGSANAANKEFAMIRQFAKDTPFSVRGLTDSFVKLTNQGFKPSQEELRKMGDLAASTGKEFDQLAEAVIDAQTGEFERLKEFGIRAQKEGDKVTFTFKGQKEQVDFTSESIQKYILGLGDLEGVSGSMAAISETLGGKISNLGDAWDSLLYNLGESSVFKEVLGVMGELLNTVNEYLEVPMSEKLREESMEMNALFGVLKSSNISQEQRSGLIKEINSTYGPYLGNLLTEKSSLEDIEKAQKAANTAYQEKILMMATKEEQELLIKEATDLQRGIFDMEKLIQEYRQNIISNPDDAEAWSEGIDMLANKIGDYKERIAETNKEFELFNERNAEILSRIQTQEEEEDPSESPQVVGARARYEAIITEAKGLHDVLGELEEDFINESVLRTQQGENLKRKEATLTLDQWQTGLGFLSQNLTNISKEFPQFAQMAKRAAQLQAAVDTYASAQAVFKNVATTPFLGPLALPLATAAAAATIFSGLARVRQIENTKFAIGGFTDNATGPVDETGFRQAGIVHEQEWVAPRWMRKSPRYASTINALEYARANNVGRYGSPSTPVASPSTMSGPVQATLDTGNFDKAVLMLSETVNNLMENGLLAVADDDFERAMKEKRERDELIITNSRI
mgnify:CR=1 FL=1